MKRKLREIARAFFSVSDRERRRILLLIPLLAAFSLLLLWQGKPRFEQSFPRYADRVSDSAAGRAPGAPRNYAPQEGSGNGRTHPLQNTPGNNDVRRETASPRGPHASATGEKRGTERKDSLFHFDPNTVSAERLVLLGFTQRQAQAILNYRNAGKVFRRAEDFASSYVVSEEKFRQLRPYIRIAIPDKTEKETNPTDSPTTTPAAPSHPAAEDTRPAAGGEPSPAGFRDVPGNGEGASAPSGPSAATAGTTGKAGNPLPGSPVELNGADSAALVALRGIGPLTAGRIVRYRERLGGFHSAEQLSEVAGVTPENYALVLQQIFVDSGGIQKIDINFAPPEQLKGHPYLPPETLNKLLKYRQLKGGWRHTGELTEQNILTEAEAERLSPYLRFSGN